MAFNKTKSQESALKYLQQGKPAQAIAEYQQILRHEPKDQATLMTLGDLFVRQGDTRQAAEYFERLGELFLHEGFNSKAIAIYKKIAKLTPAETLPLERLAELYVQQGVLSEARPLFLQLAEIHLKANRKPQATAVLRKLFEVEPENERVLAHLGELYLALGQKKEAAHDYLNFARRMMEQGEPAKAEKYADAAFQADPSFTSAILLKAQLLTAAGKPEQAIALAERIPDAEAGGETTSLLVDLALKAGQIARAAEIARKIFATGKGRHALAHRVVMAMLESGEADEALKLLAEIREPMIEAGEHEALGQALLAAAERLPGNLEPLEWLVDLYRKSSDSFRLPDAITRLADASEAAGNLQQAELLYTELLERDADNEVLLQRVNQLRAKLNKEPLTAPPAPSEALPPPEPAGPLPEPPLDDETQRYVAQALTDVDLFSSYGLSQKAILLLENVRQRAPRHTPALERLLDLYLGAGNERRTAELAAQLEKIWRSRNDSAAAERFAELRRRFQRAAKLSDEDLAAAQQAPAPAPPAEFPLPTSGNPPTSSAPRPPEAPPVAAASAAPPVAVAPSAPPPVASSPTAKAPAAHEVDLSDEWAALSDEVAEESIETLPAAPEKPEPAAEVAAPTAPEEAEASEFELQLVPATPAVEEKAAAAMTQEDFLSELAAEVEDLQVPAPRETEIPDVPVATAPGASSAEGNGESVDQLREVFQDFRAELGEMGEEEEDLETHYNLGIAYREMGLLDEAIGEFQKVAKAVQNGRPFRYAMQCSTLLGLTFMAKGDPKIAVVWYQRALETPGLDQESVLALRYDLGVAQETAGEPAHALESFRQVYAMNIDYRDVADRIAALQKQ